RQLVLLLAAAVLLVDGGPGPPLSSLLADALPAIALLDVLGLALLLVGVRRLVALWHLERSRPQSALQPGTALRVQLAHSIHERSPRRSVTWEVMRRADRVNARHASPSGSETMV